MNCSLKTFFCEGLGVGIWNRFRLERGGSHTLKRQSRKRSAYAKDGGEVNVAGLVQIFFSGGVGGKTWSFVSEGVGGDIWTASFAHIFILRAKFVLENRVTLAKFVRGLLRICLFLRGEAREKTAAEQKHNYFEL